MTEITEAATKSCILCVDSDRQWLNIMMRELNAVGIKEVLGATDPKVALAHVRDDVPDILVTSYNLQFVRFLRHSGASPNRQIPIIMVTGKLGEEEIAAMRDAGVNEIAAKPCSVAQLMKRIEAILARPREFIEGEEFTGPSRRRKHNSITGPDRRSDGNC